MARTEPRHRTGPRTQEHAGGEVPRRVVPVLSRRRRVQPISPDVVGHLLKAGSEMFLAFRAVIEHAASTRGTPGRARPSGEDRRRMTRPQAVGVDVGGTKATAVRATRTAPSGAGSVVDTPADDVPAVLTAMRARDHGGVRRRCDRDRRRGGGAGRGGDRADPLRAEHRLARGRRSHEALGGFGVPVAIDNDCTVAAFGEHAVGAGRGVEDFLYVGVGTGIGGGIVHGR